jgi:hypothetical protein
MRNLLCCKTQRSGFFRMLFRGGFWGSNMENSWTRAGRQSCHSLAECCQLTRPHSQNQMVSSLSLRQLPASRLQLSLHTHYILYSASYCSLLLTENTQGISRSICMWYCSVLMGFFISTVLYGGHRGNIISLWASMQRISICGISTPLWRLHR